MTWHDTMRDALLRGSDRQLYANSPDFHHAIDMLVAMLPSMVQGLAEESEKTMNQRRHLERAMQRAPMPSFITNPKDPDAPVVMEDTTFYWYYYVPHDNVIALGDEIEARNIADNYQRSTLIVFQATIKEVYG